MVSKKSIIYINYCPYENSGHILDYLQESFEDVYLFSLGFHTLGGKKRLNKLTIYKGSKVVSEEYLYYMSIPQQLVYFLVPVRSSINALQIVWNCIKLRLKYGKIDVFFSVNAFTTVLGMLMQKLFIVSKNIFWVWDYYPIDHPNPIVKMTRWVYWQMDKLASNSDKVIYLNNRLAKVRIKEGLVSRNVKIIKVPIGMGEQLPIKNKSLKKIRLGFIGVLKSSQGIDMLFDCANDLNKAFGKNIEIDLIGSGPDEDHFKKRAKKSPIKFNIHGLVSETKFKQILYNCTIGIAPYIPEDSNVSRYGDPGKVKRYLEFNLPSIITNVFEFSDDLKRKKAGIVIEYGNADQLVSAIKTIVKDYNRYVNNVIQLHDSYYYKKIYKKMFI
jgi:glycosyltransferase involved in cell wall biosynthesis